MKLSKKTLRPNQIVVVVEASYNVSYTPQTSLHGYENIGSLECKIGTGEKLKVIKYNSSSRTVSYLRLLDGKKYESYLGEFVTFVRLHEQAPSRSGTVSTVTEAISIRIPVGMTKEEQSQARQIAQDAVSSWYDQVKIHQE